MIVDTLQYKFSNFFKYELNEGTNNFINFESGLKSNIHIKLKNGIILPHESNEYEFNKKEYENKYNRRIERFNKIIMDEKIKKIFVRADDKFLSQKEKFQLKFEFENYGCINFDIMYINYKMYNTNNFSWKRDYIPWKDFFI